MDSLEDVMYLKKAIEEAYGPLQIVITEMGSTLGTYAGKGGIIMSF
jgi:fatty acid-binding protein DegV